MDLPRKLSGLSLCAGIGGKDLALEEWVRTVAYCEIEPYAQTDLLRNMRQGNIARAPIWDNLKTLKGDMLPKIDIIMAGFPCQDISTAGSKKGLGGEKSSLYFEVERLIGELRPEFVFLENSPAITIRGLERISMGISALGYDLEWTIVSASELGAWHERERWWLLAHIDRERLWVQPDGLTGRDSSTQPSIDGKEKSLAHTNGVGLPRGGGFQK